MITTIVLAVIIIFLLFQLLNKGKGHKKKIHELNASLEVQRNTVNELSELHEGHQERILKQLEDERANNVGETTKLNQTITELKSELTKYNQTPYIDGIGHNYAKGIVKHPVSVTNPPLGTSRVRIEMRENQPIKIFCKSPEGLTMHYGIIPEGQANIILTHVLGRNIHMDGTTNRNTNKVESMVDPKSVASINQHLKTLKGENT